MEFAQNVKGDENGNHKRFKIRPVDDNVHER